ncbi:MAG: hypothetical protein RLZZ175_2555 [Bacteroidota bacterium]|jgi:hypothetical protein
MTNFFKSIVSIILVCISISGFATSNNYVILLDLSDRITVKGQIEQDKAVIKAIYDKFYAEVKKDMFINSNASFKIVIAPQSFVPYDKNQFEAELIIDLANVTILQKRKAVEVFSSKFQTTVNNLYTKAYISNNKNQYAGCDLWKYFNDYLSSDIKTNQANKVYVLTDGYFDFENNPNIKHVGNQSTSTHFLSQLNVNNWKEVFVLKKMGIIPILKNWANTEVNVVGISPKSSDLNEIEKLKFIWENWLKSSGIKQGKMLLSTNISNILIQLKT